jgi:hypothetical protein
VLGPLWRLAPNELEAHQGTSPKAKGLAIRNRQMGSAIQSEDHAKVRFGSWLGENVSAVVPTSEHQRVSAEKGLTSCDYGWN